MNKNQKIAIGCGVGGCLGLIVLCIVGTVAFFVFRPASTRSNRNDNFNVNRSSSENSNSDTTSSDDSSSSSMSNDDKHKLFQAGAATQDSETLQRVWKKLGLAKTDGSPNDEYAQFVKEHIVWLFRNSDFLKTIDTPEKARAYVDAHMND
jgi:gas vesicle protein